MKKIVIVGGGSAGWMTAAMLIKFYPNMDISVIEDPNTPPIGVGESTYDGFRYYCKALEIDEKDFFRETNASIKIGLKIVNLYDNIKENDSFLYPFGPADVSGTMWGTEDWMIKKYLYPETPNTEFAESYYPQALLAKYNKFSKNEDGSFGTFNPDLHTALHFDAIKFGGWLRDKYCITRGVKLLKNKVVDIKTNDDGIEKLVLDNNNEIFADLFVDCTGFKSLLLGQTMNEEFINFNDVLPNNRAWATQIDYKDKRKELDSLTTCTFIENGWCWNIPLWSRLGCGYVYSDNFVSSESALEEFKKYLMSNSMSVPRTREEVDSLKFIDIKMKVGIYKRTWVKNVVAIGLSAGFIEPLESNGLFTIHSFLYHLVRALERGHISQWTRDVYNNGTYLDYFQFADFIRMHYALSIRKDTPYWEYNFNREYNFDNFSQQEVEVSSLYNLVKMKTRTFSAFSNGGISLISTGLNYNTLDSLPIIFGSMRNRMDYKTDLANNIEYLDARKSVWEINAKDSNNFYDFLKSEYYSDES